MDMDARNQFYLYFLCLHLAFTTLDIPFLPICRILESVVPGLDAIQCFAYTGISGGMSGDLDLGLAASDSISSFISSLWSRYLYLPLRIAVLLALFLDRRTARPLVAAMSIPLLHPSFFHAYTTSNKPVASLVSSLAWVVMVLMWIDLIWRCSLHAIADAINCPTRSQQVPIWQKVMFKRLYFLAVFLVDLSEDMKERVFMVPGMRAKEADRASVVLDGKEVEPRDDYKTGELQVDMV